MKVLRAVTDTNTKRKKPSEMVQREDTLTKPGYGAATVPRLAVAITGKVLWRMTAERSLAKGVQARKYFMT